MPNEKVLNDKKQVVVELTEKLRSQAGVFVNYSGINVNDDTEMRVKLREANVEYTVIKNTLMRFAINNVGFEELDPILNGTTSLAVSNDDPVAPARVIKEYADKFQGFFEIKGGFMDGKVLSISEVNSLASIPPLKTLQAQLLGTMLAPIASLAMVINAASEKDNAPEDENLAASDEGDAEAPAAAQSDDANEEASAQTDGAANEAAEESQPQTDTDAGDDGTAQPEDVQVAEAEADAQTDEPEAEAEVEAEAETVTDAEAVTEAEAETEAEADASEPEEEPTQADDAQASEEENDATEPADDSEEE